MLCLLPVVLGLIALRGIGVDLFPNVDLPIVIVTTNRPGTSVEEMETGVTKLIEEAVNTISGIDELRSTTTEGRAVVTVQFLLSKDRDIAQQEVQSKVNTIISQLPPGTETPIIDKFDVDAAPVMTVAISGTRDLKELSEIANRQIAENLSSLAGVGSVTLVGGRPRAINVTIDTARLEAFGLSITDVRDALARQNLELPGGRWTSSGGNSCSAQSGVFRIPASSRTSSSPTSKGSRSASATSARPTRSRTAWRSPGRWRVSTGATPCPSSSRNRAVKTRCR